MFLTEKLSQFFLISFYHTTNNRRIVAKHKHNMTYTGDVDSFNKLIDEGTKNKTVTISVPTVTETIDDAYQINNNT